MKSLDEANLSHAAQMFAVANTPLFLIRKLRDDPVVNEMANVFAPDDIINHLHKAVEHEPETLLDYVCPYVYLVALSKKPQDKFLKDVADMPGSERWDWFDYIRRVLLETYLPTGNQVIEMPGQLHSHNVNIRTEAPVKEQVLTVPKRA